VTIFIPDVSGFQAGIDLRGALAVAVKVTEGTGYVNPDWRRAKRNAHDHGAFAYGYHFLHAGNAAAQARFYRSQTTMPCMIDMEATVGSNPIVADAAVFADELRQIGGTVYPLYLPHWYWQSIGSPSLKPLADRKLFLVSSAYGPYTDSDSGTGWQPYGGMTPQVWQYTDALRFNGFTVDFNAYRGRFAGKQDATSIALCLADFRSMVETGGLGHADPSINPVNGLAVTRRGYTSVNLGWIAPAGATGYTVKAYRSSTGNLVSQAATTAPAIRVGGLRPGRTYEFKVRAHPGASTGADATVKATTR